MYPAFPREVRGTANPSTARRSRRDDEGSGGDQRQHSPRRQACGTNVSTAQSDRIGCFLIRCEFADQISGESFVGLRPSFSSHVRLGEGHPSCCRWGSFCSGQVRKMEARVGIGSCVERSRSVTDQPRFRARKCRRLATSRQLTETLLSSVVAVGLPVFQTGQCRKLHASSHSSIRNSQDIWPHSGGR
ncbi:MAG: hypothetical protein QOJ42_1633 [Acidobacteriaceae bacterium]|nr:hypothetical protein [Acidobacteriaceae bacterium]